MKPADYLKSGKELLESVVNQRNYLVRTNKGHIDSEWAKTQIANIGYARATIKDARKMKQYIERKETIIRYMIPSGNRKRENQLRELIKEEIF